LPRPARSANAPSRRRAAPVLVALVVGIAVGWVARDRTAPRIADQPPMRPVTSADAAGSSDASDPAVDDRDASLRLWSALAFSLANRSNELEALLDELAAQDRDPRASIDQAIAAASDPELATILSAVTRIDEDELLAQGDLRPFASRLVEVALDGLRGPSVEPPPDRRVYFAATTRDFDPDTTAQDAFPADQGRIFATIDLDGYEGDRVMVKWLNTGTGRIHSLQSMPHEPGRPLWSYLVRDGGWDPGLYQVSVYSQDAAMQLLARGAYTVFDEHDPAARGSEG
jgi:hypothetical protein